MIEKKVRQETVYVVALRFGMKCEKFYTRSAEYKRLAVQRKVYVRVCVCVCVFMH